MQASDYNLTRKLVAEMIGTGFLLASIVGSGIMVERTAGGNQALALLGSTLSTGALLIVLILMFMPISGAHFNPAVSLAFLIRGSISKLHFVTYICAQLAGGLLGVISAHAMFAVPVLSESTIMRTGFPLWLSEIIATFGLVGVILTLLKARPSSIPYAVGLYIAAAYWFTASTAFANPVVTISRAFTNTTTGIQLINVFAFVSAQLTGAVLAVICFGWLLSSVKAS